MAELFDSQTFADLLGAPISENNNDWGQEKRYLIDSKRLEAFKRQLVATVYNHHSSFDYYDELVSLGYPIVADIMRKYRSGLPSLPATQMGNFGEVIGTEYGKWLLGYDTTIVMPKHLNPNVDQSMKGVDIIGITKKDDPLGLLLGEVKCYKDFASKSVRESHKHLAKLWSDASPKLFFFAKEALKLEGNKNEEAIVDRVSYNVNRAEKRSLILVINQDYPEAPFVALDELTLNTSLPSLVGVHICIENLKDWMAIIYGEP